MNDARDTQSKSPAGESEFSRQVGVKAARKLKAQRQVNRTVWFGLGMMGLVGWSVVMPALVGVGIGLWLDASHPWSHSWTLVLMPVGLALGCFSAWRWVSREGQQIREQEESEDE
jgi:ATP synthase protein I